MSKIAYPAHPEVPISKAVRAGDFIFTSAYGPWTFDPKNVVFDQKGIPLSDGSGLEGMDFEKQVHCTFEHVKAALAFAGATLDDVVDAQCWLSDPRDFVAFNAVYKTYFKKDPPVRCVFKAEFMFCCKVEIKVTAYRPGQKD